MRCFPQMSTGSTAQYPMVRRRRKRSVVNQTPGGGRITWADAAAETIEWELTLDGLTTAEWRAIEELFETCGGSASDFLFLDPLDNLLGWSEDLTAAAWTCGPLLERTAGWPDPLGTTRATRLVNTGQAPQRLTQTLGAPSWQHYCLSARVRSANPGLVKLVLAGPGQEESRIVETNSEWREAWLPGAPGGTAETVTAGIELAAGASVEIFGPQLEAQLGPSSYKRTPGRGGAYPSARFLDSLLRGQADGIESYSTTVRITSRRGDV